MLAKEEIEKYGEKFEGLFAQEILKEALALFGADRVALASSLAAEDQVLTAMLIEVNPKAQIFTIDTGRLPEETCEVMRITMERYHFQYEILSPDHKAVEKMAAEKGPDLFYESLENRHLCCRVRKVEPLRRRLAGLDAWICGLRREQSATRTNVRKIEWDEANGLVKINPLADWGIREVWEYILNRDVPYNVLHDKGYPSIGCAPCTRAIRPGEDIRAGRWWWEKQEHKECGLHRRHGIERGNE